MKRENWYNKLKIVKEVHYLKSEVIKAEMEVANNKISIMRINNIDYISITDLAKYANPDDPSGVIRNWMSNKNSFAFYSLWEELNNENFNSVESHRIRTEEVGYNRFTMTPNRWKKEFNSIGIIPSSGKYSKGTFAHPDIAFEFASWLSPEFKMYLIKEFERLKSNEAYQNKIEWHANRVLSKANYLIHTDAIKESIIPNLTDKQKSFVYAEEADLLHLIILNNLENINATLIKNGISQKERLVSLNQAAKKQIEILSNNKNIKELERLQDQVNNGTKRLEW